MRTMCPTRPIPTHHNLDGVLALPICVIKANPRPHLLFRGQVIKIIIVVFGDSFTWLVIVIFLPTGYRIGVASKCLVYGVHHEQRDILAASTKERCRQQETKCKSRNAHDVMWPNTVLYGGIAVYHFHVFKLSAFAFPLSRAILLNNRREYGSDKGGEFSFSPKRLYFLMLLARYVHRNLHRDCHAVQKRRAG